LKGKFVENGLEKQSKTDWTKMILKEKSPDSDKKDKKASEKGNP